MKNLQIIENGIGGYCDSYNIDRFEVDGVNVASRFTHYMDANRRYYIIPCDRPDEVLSVFGGLKLEEDEPGTLLLRNSDDVTALNVGVYAAGLPFGG